MSLKLLIDLVASSSDFYIKAINETLDITQSIPVKTKEYEKFSVAVIATMSSGKSTTLNAMLGSPLLPAKNEACTAVLTVIEDVDGMEGTRARSIDRDGVVSNWQEISEGSCTLSKWNCSENRIIEIQGDFPHINQYSKKIEFIDTPGPNNSVDRTHAEITHEIILKCRHSYVVFLMDATQFGVDDERALLEIIFECLAKNRKQSKIVFAVNKIDKIDIEKEGEPIILIEKIKAYLRDIGFEYPNVIPVMSKISLEIRQCLSAHRKGTALPFSDRLQRKVLSDIKLVLEHFDVYLEALLNGTDNEKYLTRAFDQDRNINSKNHIKIAGEDIPIECLIEADLLTGIPFLEEMLELELMTEKDNEPDIFARALKLHMQTMSTLLGGHEAAETIEEIFLNFNKGFRW